MVADFGLARNMFDGDYYRKKHDRPKPIRWMALESIQEDIYTSKTDVVSVCLRSARVVCPSNSRTFCIPLPQKYFRNLVAIRNNLDIMSLLNQWLQKGPK